VVIGCWCDQETTSDSDYRKDIQACVDPFSTSKAHEASRKVSKTTKTAKKAALTEQASAGRYGIGLTLCLLHAQRLVPDSSACIKSATSSHPQWTQVMCVVDTDRVQCIRRDYLPKSVQEESGTSISVLVPVSSSSTRVTLSSDDCLVVVFLLYCRGAKQLPWFGPSWYVKQREFLSRFQAFQR
jgi:hypothetical protein